MEVASLFVAYTAPMSDVGEVEMLMNIFKRVCVGKIEASTSFPAENMQCSIVELSKNLASTNAFTIEL